MPTNLLKVYNELLDLASLPEAQRMKSLRGVFDRDFTNNPNMAFRTKKVKPTPAEGQDYMDRLFTHLTTVISIVDKDTRHREFDIKRSQRLHWIRHHLEERKTDRVLVFSVEEPEGIRTYIYDEDERYVIVLEPKIKAGDYFLLTAYYVEGKDAKRDKIKKKWSRRLPTLY